MSDYEVTGIDDFDDPLMHFALFSDCDPTNFEAAVKEKKWQKAMDEEIAAVERNNTWELTELPKGQKKIGVKWVYKTKLKENGKVDKYKARLVAKDYKKEFGVDYKEMFALVAKHDNQIDNCLGSSKFMTDFSIGCEMNVFTWRYIRRGIYRQPLG